MSLLNTASTEKMWYTLTLDVSFADTDIKVEVDLHSYRMTFIHNTICFSAVTPDNGHNYIDI